MRTAAILPVKRFTRAKQRLGASVADSLRAALAAAMVADVMQALASTSAIESTIVVTAEPSLAATAAAHGARVIADAREHGQSAAVGAGVREALSAGVERVLCVPGDCPTLDPLELAALLEHAREEVVVMPDRHGTGTNGLLLAPPDAIAASFGEDSCARHRALAQAASLRCRVERLPSLLLDVDTGADLDALRARLAEHPSVRAPRTRAVLGHAAGPRAATVNTPA
ncbi:MAG TPA: 2-phospho-L-lactate guanylyltransferase [Solirubrobacteraceae bacterium]|nr:2-phospho-L-lactate guanylyltransferase [Solirubrobacteraceae bacterium]